MKTRHSRTHWQQTARGWPERGGLLAGHVCPPRFFHSLPKHQRKKKSSRLSTGSLPVLPAPPGNAAAPPAAPNRDTRLAQVVPARATYGHLPTYSLASSAVGAAAAALASSPMAAVAAGPTTSPPPPPPSGSVAPSGPAFSSAKAVAPPVSPS